jgi:DNA-binding response OmpR family regulator
MKPEPADRPRLLLVEDDPVSAAFLREAAAALPAFVDVAGGVASALDAASHATHDLVLIDAHLPDGSGEALLVALRARGVDVPALAHTAALDVALHERLLAAGFIEVLCKPIGVAALHEALRRHLDSGVATGGKLPSWDDAAALGALGGERGHVEALRALFLKELPAQRARIEAAAAIGDEATMRGELHRLVASCGFVGAARLAASVRALQASPTDTEALQRFGFTVDDALASA